MGGLYRFLLNKWYFDELFDAILVEPAKALGFGLWKGGDGRHHRRVRPRRHRQRCRRTSRSRRRRLQSGYVYHYAFAMLIGVVILITWYMFGSGVVRSS